MARTLAAVGIGVLVVVLAWRWLSAGAVKHPCPSRSSVAVFINGVVVQCIEGVP